MERLIAAFDREIAVLPILTQPISSRRMSESGFWNFETALIAAKSHHTWL